MCTPMSLLMSPMFFPCPFLCLQCSSYVPSYVPSMALLCVLPYIPSLFSHLCPSYFSYVLPYVPSYVPSMSPMSLLCFLNVTYVHSLCILLCPHVPSYVPIPPPPPMSTPYLSFHVRTPYILNIPLYVTSYMYSLFPLSGPLCPLPMSPCPILCLSCAPIYVPSYFESGFDSWSL